ncbi:MAG: 1-acyl-sn-glycerol-3-phosphate acyltransferase [Acholeplasmatales bacterium]|nr:1-acyl-sn-glycerol-3-phosphate acyltransferase [Acholeplasmatales bacterium]
MIAHNIIVGLSIIASLLIYFLTGQYTTWYYAFFLLAYFAAAYIAIILLYMLFIAVLSWFMQRKDTPEEPNKFFYGIIRETAMFLLFMSRCKIKKVGTNLEPKERYLLVTNHQSNYDPIIVFKCLKNNPLVCVTKPEVMKKPVIGKWVRYSGFIPIERDDLVQAAGAINTAAKYIKNDKASICIYPEGKRNFESEDVLPFHPGSFKIAFRSKCPLVIASTKGTKNIKNNFPFKRTKVRFKILCVLNYDEYKDMSTSDLAQYARDIIDEDLKV